MGEKNLPLLLMGLARLTGLYLDLMELMGDDTTKIATPEMMDGLLCLLFLPSAHLSVPWTKEVEKMKVMLHLVSKMSLMGLSLTLVGLTGKIWFRSPL